MSAFPDYDLYDAVGLAGLVQNKEVSARELLDEALTRCDRVNGELNCVIFRCEAEAQREALAVDISKPLAGVPFLVKDLGPALAGAPLTAGSKLFSKFIPVADGEIVRRFKAAGLIPFGKTNVPEFGLVPVTEPALHGICRNPWDTSLTPGGSSGGAASAVASGIVPLAHASDGGGSIRIPASCCGLIGLKPTRGLTPRDPVETTITDDFSIDNVVSRTVRDSAAALDAVSNGGHGRFLNELERPQQSLRIAVVRSAMLGSSVAPEVKLALDKTVNLLQDLGHRIHEVEPRIDYDEAATAFLTYWAAGAHQTLEGAEGIVGRKAARRDVELATWTLGVVGSVISHEDLAKARTAIWRTTKAFTDFLNIYDIVLSPALASLPLPIGKNKTTATEAAAMRLSGALKYPWLLKGLLKLIAARSFAFAAFTAPFNMTGQPAISVPLQWTEGGLPVGMQFAARAGSDGVLLRLARQLEIAQPWAGRHPKVWSGNSLFQAA